MGRVGNSVAFGLNATFCLKIKQKTKWPVVKSCNSIGWHMAVGCACAMNEHKNKIYSTAIDHGHTVGWY